MAEKKESKTDREYARLNCLVLILVALFFIFVILEFLRNAVFQY